jgi:hypothetical protein
MSIANIISLNTLEYGKYARIQKDRLVATPVRKVVDTYEPATETGSEDRKALISTIRNRIKTGYYNSEEVVDDLGNSFAKVLDKLL